jgi:hypothetical protein
LYTKVAVALLLATIPAAAQYSGPNVLSRGYGSSTGQRGGVDEGIRIYAGVSGSYETGIVPSSVDSTGNITDYGSTMGVLANVGAYGHKDWKRTRLELDYFGNFRHYTENSYLDGIDNMLSLGVARQISKRVQLFTNTAAGTVSRYYAAAPIYAVGYSAVPTTPLLDNRLYYLQNITGIQYTPTLRWSFTMSGTGYINRYQSSSLIGLQGYGGSASAEYRMSRRRSLLLSYQFMHIDYQRTFGDADAHIVMAGVAQQLSRRWTLSFSGGASRTHAVGIEQVAADPVTAALFGTQVVSKAFDSAMINPAFNISLNGTYRRWGLSASYAQMPNPGNGIYLTSNTGSATGRFSYTGIRRATLSAFGGYYFYTSIGQTSLGKYTYWGGGASSSYRLTKSLDAFAMWDMRSQQIHMPNGLDQVSQRVTFGVNWHSSELPVTFW